jgi:hypothetical protein
MLRALALLLLALALSPSALAAADLAPYRDLGTWIDLYDDPQWAAPEATVAAIQARGVRTIYLETGNFRQRSDLVLPQVLGRFVEAAHTAGIQVVAWYLPSLKNVARDLRRSLAAIEFRTLSGQAFDSFALDIEASDVRSVTRRNARLLDLSQRLRAAVGSSYSLGAIIPSPRGMELRPDYWSPFPYAELASVYDVLLPMVYSTYHGDGARVVVLDTTRSIQILRSETGRPDVPIHIIGGLGDALSRAEARAFARSVAACAPAGFSLYDFSVTKPSAWAALAAPARPGSVDCG